MKIYKYELQITDHQVIDLPIGSITLTVQVQKGMPCIWALVDEVEVKTKRHTIRTYGTGHIFDSDLYCKYIGTYQIQGGELVFHVFNESENKS